MREHFFAPAFGRLSLVLAMVCGPLAALAQDSGPLIDALIRKGILTNQEAEDIRAELVRESNTVPAHAIAGGKSTERLSVGMRLHLQFADLDTDVRGAFGPPATQHFFLRRMYLTLRAGVGRNCRLRTQTRGQRVMGRRHRRRIRAGPRRVRDR